MYCGRGVYWLQLETIRNLSPYRHFAPKGLIVTGPPVPLQLLWLCVGKSSSAVNYWGVTLNLMLSELFCYFPDIICCTCIFSTVLKSLNPDVFQAAMYIVFLKKLYCLQSVALLTEQSPRLCG